MHPLHTKKRFLPISLWFTVLFFLCTGNGALGQQLHFKQYSLKEGLSRSGVYDIHEDQNGFLWVATEGGGVCRFDGVNFEVFTRYHGLASENVRTIFEDRDGTLWFGTPQGLNYFNKTKFETLSLEEGLIDNFIRCIAQDTDGNLWIGTNKGISIIDAQQKEVSGKLKLSFSLPHKKVRALLAGDDCMWIGTDGGLCQYKDGKIKLINTQENLIGNTILCLYKAQDTLWIGTETGLSRYTNDTTTNWTVKDGLINNRVRAITKDQRGNIWIGTRDGISVFDGTRFSKVNAKNGLQHERIRCLTTDSFENIWIGTYFGGIMRFNHQDFIAYTDQEGLASNQILSINENKNGELMVGTFDGVSTLQLFRGQITGIRNTTEANGLKSNSVRSVIQDKNGVFWYGSDKGLTLIDKQRVISNVPAIKDQITVIKELDSVFWIGTENGVVKIRTENYIAFQMERFSPENGLAGKQVSNIISQPNGQVWVSFSDGGLTLFEEDRLITPNNLENIDEISAFTIDDKGNFWIGTNGNGIFYGKYNAETHEFDLKNLNASNGLSSNYIFSIIHAHETIWAGHEKGLDLIVSHPDSNAVVFHYGPERGFIGLQNSQNTTFKDREGNLWFGTVNGLFCLRNEERNAFTEGQFARSYLKSVRVNGAEGDWKNSDRCRGTDGVFNLPVDLEVPYYENNISFEFTALNFISPEGIRYSWKLDGFDTDWKPSTEMNTATYTNLYPGKYKFLLRTSDEHGHLSEEYSIFKFKISKPWWSTWVARIIFFLIAICIIAIILRLRTRQLLKKQFTLEETIRERTEKITAQNDELQVKNQEITDSILYSRRIQQAILPGTNKLNTLIPNHFVYYRPKDIISGDFYWVEKSTAQENTFHVAVADCTGHGVPGAMVSLVGTRALNSSVRESQFILSSDILDETNKIMLEAFTDKQSGNIIKDGMDIALITFQYTSDGIQLHFAGAHNSLWIVRPKKKKNVIIDGVEQQPNIETEAYNLFEIKGNKQPIGYFEKHQPFLSHDCKLQKGDRLYMTTDGFPDQFGGPNGKKFKYKFLKKALLDIQDTPIAEQQKKLKETFTNWKGELEQLDDVCIMGITL